ncbi:MAG: nucleotidyltransferase family protein [Candidatus Omnitrophota bacterium]
MNPDIKEIRKKILPVLWHYDVVKAAIFGSFARGEFKKNSDIDILVKFKGSKSLLDLAGLKITLEELLHKQVDVVTYNSLHPLLKDRILQEQKVIL